MRRFRGSREREDFDLSPLLRKPITMPKDHPKLSACSSYNTFTSDCSIPYIINLKKKEISNCSAISNATNAQMEDPSYLDSTLSNYSTEHSANWRTESIYKLEHAFSCLSQRGPWLNFYLQSILEEWKWFSWKRNARVTELPNEPVHQVMYCDQSFKSRKFISRTYACSSPEW